jgi:hypothetical protein
MLALIVGSMPMNLSGRPHQARRCRGRERRGSGSCSQSSWTAALQLRVGATQDPRVARAGTHSSRSEPRSEPTSAHFPADCHEPGFGERAHRRASGRGPSSRPGGINTRRFAGGKARVCWRAGGELSLRAARGASTVRAPGAPARTPVAESGPPSGKVSNFVQIVRRDRATMPYGKSRNGPRRAAI